MAPSQGTLPSSDTTLTELTSCDFSLGTNQPTDWEQGVPKVVRSHFLCGTMYIYSSKDMYHNSKGVTLHRHFCKVPVPLA